MRLRIVELNSVFNVERYEEYGACPSSGPSGYWNHLKMFSTQEEAEQYTEGLINIEKQLHSKKVIKEYDSNESLLGIHYPRITGRTLK